MEDWGGIQKTRNPKEGRVILNRDKDSKRRTQRSEKKSQCVHDARHRCAFLPDQRRAMRKTLYTMIEAGGGRRKYARPPDTAV